MKNVYQIALLFLFLACSNEPPPSSLVPIYGVTPPTLCTEYVNPQITTCSPTCEPPEFHVASDPEKALILDEIKNSTATTEDEKKFKQENIQSAKGICVPGPELKRPEESIFVKPDYCSCLNGKPDINNQCTTFCRGTTGGPTLYGSVILGEKVILNEILGSLERWCNAEIPGVPGVAPKCVLQVDDGKSKESLDMTIPPKSNNFTVNINTLKMNVTYVAKIVESGSNTNNASSNTFQFRRVPPPITNPIFPGPLKITPINQYTCITRVGESDPNTRSNYFNLKATNHYYYDPRQVPPVGPPNAFVYCYDRDQYGPIDRITYPRLELVPKAFSLWDQNDIRFSDTNGDGNADINTLIDTEMQVKYGIEAKTNYFVPFKWPTAPSISAEGTPEAGGEAAISTLGYMMRVFIDPYTGVGKCPTQEDYFGADPTFQALRGVVGVDTEAIFIGSREKQTLYNPDGTTTEIPPDIILIKESLLKQIWFYIENNLIIKPDDVTSSQQTLYFYYPPAPGYIDPYVKKSYQELYTVRDRGSLGATAPTSGSTDTPVAGLPSYDKRFGCIPADISPREIAEERP
jgi:hypothetical protein